MAVDTVMAELQKYNELERDRSFLCTSVRFFSFVYLLIFLTFFFAVRVKLFVVSLWTSRRRVFSQIAYVCIAKTNKNERGTWHRWSELYLGEKHAVYDGKGKNILRARDRLGMRDDTTRRRKYVLVPGHGRQFRLGGRDHERPDPSVCRSRSGRHI